MKLITIDSETLGDGLFALLRAMPALRASEIKLTPDMLHVEAAAQSALIDVMEGRVTRLDELPPAVQALMAAFIAQFLLDLTGRLSRERWSVPADALPSDQARYAIAQLLQQSSPRDAVRQ